MKTGRRGFLKGLLGSTAGAAAVTVPGAALALPEKQQVVTKVVGRGKYEGLTRSEIIDVIVDHSGLWYGPSYENDTEENKAKIRKARQGGLRGRLNTMSNTELIIHAEEFLCITITNPKLGE